jgi:phospholipid transport system transporter-binding protein
MADPLALRLPESLMHEEAPATVLELVQALQTAGSGSPGAGRLKWVIDASNLRRFDSSALAVLLECRRVAQERGGGIELTGAPRKLDQLARLYRLEDLLPMQSAAQASPV